MGKSTLFLGGGNRNSSNPQPGQLLCHRLSELGHVALAIYTALLISLNERIFCYHTVAHEISKGRWYRSHSTLGETEVQTS